MVTSCYGDNCLAFVIQQVCVNEMRLLWNALLIFLAKKLNRKLTKKRNSPNVNHDITKKEFTLRARHDTRKIPTVYRYKGVAFKWYIDNKL